MTTTAAIELPRYRSHKTVWALKIRTIDGNVIVPEDDSYGPLTVSDEYLAKHKPMAGGYYVQYQDGYQSFSPAEAFEGGYKPLPTRKILTVTLLSQIAEICHETNRAYCETIGDTSQLPWAEAPDWQAQSAKNGVSFHWSALERGEEPTPEQSHNNWLKEKREAGWTYGEKKDPEAKTHPCFKPYNDLPLEQRMKDYLFINVVKAFFFAH